MTGHKLYRIVRTLQERRQAEVASYAGIRQPTLNAFELGKASIALNRRLKIAECLNLNPLYIAGESSNPFKSDDLIKFRLPEGIDGIDYSIIYFIAEHNKYLSFIFFTSLSPSYSKFLDDTVFAHPVISISIKDADGNIFLLNRKTHKPLVGERELIGKLSGLGNERKIKIGMNHHLLSAGQEVRFKNFSITKDEMLHYFDGFDDMIVTTKEENELIKCIRENAIKPQEIIDYLRLVNFKLSFANQAR